MPPPSQFFPGFRSLNTSNPVLFINTNGDPVTPTASARQMSKYFSGSGVIIVDGPGHGFEAAPSKCAYEAVNRYFRNGTVPRGEMWCKTDVDASYYFGADRPKWLQQYFKL